MGKQCNEMRRQASNSEMAFKKVQKSANDARIAESLAERHAHVVVLHQRLRVGVDDWPSVVMGPANGQSAEVMVMT